jgi:large subunit ribosomal protein L28
MAKSEITGKRKMNGNNVSHSNIKTKRWQKVNVQKRRIWVPEISRFLTVKLTTSEIRTVDKIGFVTFARRHGYKIPGLV